MFETTDTREFDTTRWAAEELALQLGWLRECPFHGEPFKDTAGGRARAGVIKTLPVVPSDSPGDLYTLAAQLSRSYAEHCPLCAQESALLE